ncbi:MAG: PKD domain-containing protein [bacterium]|nr:PKD domain-containing protein [bacterium]
MVRALTKISHIVFSLIAFSFFNEGLGQCNANFSLPTIKCFGDNVSFTNSSSGSNLRYFWDFGDPFSGSANTDTLSNPSHQYKIDGLINVKLIIYNSNGCADTVTKSMRILKKLTADYTVSQTCLNQSAAFISTTAIDTFDKITSHAWTFGDGGTASTGNPSHSYTSTGNKNIRYIVNTNYGCVDTISNSITVFDAISLTTNKDSACLGDLITFSMSAGSSSTSSYKWDFGDASSSLTQNTSHQYNSSGNFIVKAIFTYSNGSVCEASKQIKINAKPNASFAIFDSIQCFKKNSVCLKLKPSGALLSYCAMSFDDGFVDYTTGLKDSIICHTYTDVLGGRYMLSVNMIDKKGCASSFTSPVKVIIYPELDARAKFTNAVGCFKTSVAFTNISNQSPPQVTSYKWDFGDGSFDNSNWATVTHDYVKDGVFNLRLILVNNIGCTDTFLSLGAVKNTNFSVDAKLDSAIDVCRSTNRLRFKQTNNPGAFIYWNMDNGDTIYNKFTHTYHYKQVGVYHPKFFITKNNCGKTVILDSLIIFGPQAAIGNISNQYQCSIRDTITLNNISTYYKNKSLKFFWDVGDGFASNCTSNTKKGINVNGNCRYSEDSTGVRHMYTPGKEGCYAPMLIITDTTIGCRDTSIVALPLTKPNAKTGLTVFSKALCPGPEKYKRVNLDFSKTVPGCGQQSYWVIWDSAYAATTSNFDSNWRFMDTFHNYDYSKIQQNGQITIGIVLQNGTDTNSKQCTDTAWYPNIIKFSKVNPKFTSNFDPKKHFCKNSVITFTMTDTTQADSMISMVWWWGDGSFTKVTNCQPISHKFKNAGIFKTVLALQHKGSCLGSDTMTIQIGYSNFFSPTLGEMCVGGSVTFYKYVSYWNDPKFYWYDSARFNKGLESFKWNFGDGNGFNNSDALPTIQYNKIGNYKLSLATVDSAGCKDTFIHPNLIKVYRINADFKTVRDTFICAQQVAFNSIISTYDSLSGIIPYNGIVKAYKWTFGKSISPSILPSPSKYLKTGTYKVKLFIETDKGCTDSTTKNITIVGPQAYYEFDGDSAGCAPLKIKFKNKSTLSANYLWQFGEVQKTSFFTTKDTTISYTYGSYGNYYPTLTATAYMTNNGFPVTCTSVFPDTPFTVNLRKVTAYEQPKTNFATNINCNTRTVSFSNQSYVNVGNIASNYWDFGDGDTSTNANPVHQYPDSGTYIVTLNTTTNNGCTGQVKIPVRVAYAPIVSFNKKDVCLGNSIQFSDSLGTFNDKVYYWSWYFGDGNYSYISNPLKTYSSASVYSVKLTVYTLSGCINSITKDVWVHSRPNTNFTFTNKCLKDTIRLNNTTTSKESPVSYLWSLGNGDTAMTLSPNKIYTSAGNYTVKLLATTPFGCSDSISKTVISYPLPSASFKVNYNNTCKIGNRFVFTNTSTTDTGALAYHWKFNNNDTSILKDNTFVYPASGTYFVKLIAKTAYNCRDTSIDTINVYPNPVSKIKMAPSADVCINSTQFKFTDTSSISSGNWTRKWLTGDNNSSTDSVLNYRYNDTGNYTVKLITLSNFNCPDTLLFKVRVSPKPIANFTINNPNQCVNGNVFSYTNTSQDSYGITSSNWHFGDGDSSLNLNSIHSYKYQDTFKVKLIAFNNSACSDTIQKSIIVYPKPSAQFTIIDTLPCEVNNQFLFINNSKLTYGTMSNSWTFGDMRSASTLNTSHSYDTFGTYSVRLIVNSNQGCKDTITKNTTVFPMPIPAFNVNNQSQCLNNQNFIFTNLSTINKDSFNSTWILGEKDSTTTKNASKQFKTSSIFSVSLILKSNKGCIDSAGMQVKVFPKPFSQYSVNDSTQCLNTQAYNFINLSTIQSGMMNYNWSLGNGYSTSITPVNYRYATHKVYKVTLTTQSDSGCIDSFSRNIEVYPKPISNIATNDSGQCVNNNLFFFKGQYKIPYSAVNTYYWNLDGAYKKASIDTFKRYSDTGIQSISFVAESINQCRDTSSLNIYIQPKPTALFAINDSGQCENNNLFIFTNNSQSFSGNLTYLWNFGDSQTSNLISIQKTYTKHDTLAVSLIAYTSVNCQDTFTRTVIIYPKPVPSFYLGDSEQCLFGNRFSFNNTSKIPSGTLSYLWKTATGFKDTQLNSEFTYSKEGSYQIKLHVTSNLGCRDSIAHYATVHPEPKADYSINNLKQCQNNQSFEYTNKSTVNYGTLNYRWQLGDGKELTTKDIIYQYATHGLKSIQLKVTTDKSCTDSITKTIRVYARPIVAYATNDTVQCVNDQNLTFITTSSIAEGSIKKYYWNFGDGVIDSGISTSHYFSYTRIYAVTHIVISDSLCVDSIKKTIRIYPKPIAEFTINDSAQCLKDNNYRFTDASKDVSGIKNYLWNIDLKRLAFTSVVTHQFADTGYKKIELTITSNNGCRDTTWRNVYLKRMPDAGFTKLAPYYCMNGPVVTMTPNEKGGTFYGKNMINDQYVPTKLWRDSVQYKITVNGCSDSLLYTTEVYPPPIVKLGNDTTLCKFESFILNASNWNSTYKWNNTFMTDSSQKITKAGTYIVTATSVCGATSDTIVVQYRDNNCRFYMPSAFTPNNDERNEYFKPITRDISSLTMRIFNRWGEKIYEGDLNEVGWDGTFMGNLVQQDVYLWQVEYKYILGSGYITQFENGTLNLLR